MHEHEATTPQPPQLSQPPQPFQDRPAPEAEAETDAEAGVETADAPSPLGVGVQPTGHPRVDAELRRLADADRLVVAAHLEVYEDVHRALRDTLTALDQRPGPGGPPAPPAPSAPRS
jgi:hypothetical protein